MNFVYNDYLCKLSKFTGKDLTGKDEKALFVFMQCLIHTNLYIKWAWWYIPIIPALRRPGQEDHKLEASLGYIVRACLKNKYIYFFIFIYIYIYVVCICVYTCTQFAR
jgi:hypothetical protein